MTTVTPGRELREPAPALAALLRNAYDLARLGERYAWPLVDLGIRLWFAATLFPIEAFWPLGPLLGLLLALGVLVPPVAIATIALCLYVGVGFVGHAAEVVLLVRLAVVGASTISLDAFFERGAASLALPGARTARDSLEQLAIIGSPPIRFLIRLLAAAIFAVLAFADPSAYTGFILSGWAPGPLDEPFRGLAAVVAMLLALGLGTRILGLLGFLVLAFAADASAVGPALLLLLIGLLGGGSLALDQLIERSLTRRYRHLFEPPRWDDPALPHVVVVGAGFGGINAVQALAHTPCRITLIDRRNYHLFQPLLYQVATATLAPADVATPIRELFRDQSNVRVMLGRVTGVERAHREVLVGETRVAYDYLVLATGARHSYFGNEQWEPLAPGLKKIDDATDIRRRILLALERAETATDPAERAAFLTFVVVGGGPTGVEIAGTLIELVHHGVEREFRNCDPREARVMLVDGGDLPLKPFPKPLSQYTAEALQELGVELKLGRRVTAVDEEGVVAGDERIPARTVIWAAGVIASPASRWLDADHDRAGRVKVGPDLSVPGSPEIFVVGDTALAEAWEGKPVPGLAPAAKQGGLHVARVIHRRILGRPAPKPFVYKHQGNLATIGRKSAVADLGRVWLKGAPAWWFWGAIHVLFLVGARNRIAVMLEWFWAYLTFRRSTRLITGPEV